MEGNPHSVISLMCGKRGVDCLVKILKGGRHLDDYFLMSNKYHRK